MSTSSPRRWYREPMTWLLLALPVATLVAIGFTVRIASQHAALDGSAEPVRRIAQVQQTDLGADRAALAQALAAELHVDGERAWIEFATPPLPVPGLLLYAQHPTRADGDRTLPLRQDGGRWWLDQPLDRRIAWSLSLQPIDGSWRIDGQLLPGQTGSRLRPRFADD